MKKYIILFLAVSNSVAFGQSKTVHKSITSDGNALSIHVSGTIEGDDFDFDRTFDISSLEKVAKLVFKDKILDSLDVFISEISENPAIPNAPKVPKIRKSLNVPKQPISKEVKYNTECGELFLRYKYEKDGEEYEYERTINAKNKSESERMHMIEETERELGLTIIK